MIPAGLERKVALANGLLLCGLLPLAVLASWNAGRSIVELRQIDLSPLPPRLEELDAGAPEIPAVPFPQALFRLPEPPAPKPAVSQTAVREVRWKLNGVLLGAGKKAYLEDSEGHALWVSEGEMIGSAAVKEIRERSVLMEKDGKEYEIRM